MAESGNEYIKRKMSGGKHSLKKLARVRRKANLIDAGLMESDDTHIDAANLRFWDADEGTGRRRVLHATKGIRTICNKRDAIQGLSKPQMWKIIGNNIAETTGRYAHMKGLDNGK